MAQLENPGLCWLRNTALRVVPVGIQTQQLGKVLEFEVTGFDGDLGASGWAGRAADVTEAPKGGGYEAPETSKSR